MSEPIAVPSLEGEERAMGDEDPLVEAIRAQLREDGWSCEGHEPDNQCDACHRSHTLTAQRILAVVEQFGRLLPDGGETVAQYGVRWPSGWIENHHGSPVSARDAAERRHADISGEVVTRRIMRWKSSQRRTPGARYFGPWEGVGNG